MNIHEQHRSHLELDKLLPDVAGLGCQISSSATGAHSIGPSRSFMLPHHPISLAFSALRGYTLYRACLLTVASNPRPSIPFAELPLPCHNQGKMTERDTSDTLKTFDPSAPSIPNVPMSQSGTSLPDTSDTFNAFDTVEIA